MEYIHETINTTHRSVLHDIKGTNRKKKNKDRDYIVKITVSWCRNGISKQGNLGNATCGRRLTITWTNLQGESHIILLIDVVWVVLHQYMTFVCRQLQVCSDVMNRLASLAHLGTASEVSHTWGDKAHHELLRQPVLCQSQRSTSNRRRKSRTATGTRQWLWIDVSMTNQPW